MRPDVLLTMLADIIALGMLDEIRWVAYVPAEYLEAAYTRAVTPQFTPSAKWPFFAAATPSSSDESDADEEMGGEFTSSSIPSTSQDGVYSHGTPSSEEEGSSAWFDSFGC